MSMTNEHVILQFSFQGMRREIKSCDAPDDLEADSDVRVIYADSGQMPECEDCAAFMSAYMEADTLEAMGYFGIDE